MSASANVRSIRAFGDLKVALDRFTARAEEVLIESTTEINRTLDWLQGRQNHWQNEFQAAQDWLSRAVYAYERCQASGAYDSESGAYIPPDCSFEERQVLEARVRLERARDALERVVYWMNAVREAGAEYQPQAQRLATILGQEVAAAGSLLTESAATLQSYAAVTAVAGASPPASAVPAGQAGPASKPAPVIAEAPGTHPERVEGAEREPSVESIDGSSRGPERL